MRPSSVGLPWPRMLALGLIILSVYFFACTYTKQLQAQIVDVKGNPISGAVVYYETIARHKAFDFGFTVANENGDVPAKESPPIRVSWRPGARISLAVFAPGYVPTVLMNPPGKVNLMGSIIMLRKPTQSILPFEPRLFVLAFPFEELPKLRTRLSKPEYEPLRQAFVTAYELIDTGDRVLPSHERAKIDAVLRLKTHQ